MALVGPPRHYENEVPPRLFSRQCLEEGRPDIPHLDAAEGGGASEVLSPPLARGGRCARVQTQLQPVDEIVAH